MIDKIKLELTKKEARLFVKWFRKHQDIWERAESLRPGCLSIHLDIKNNIMKTEFHYYVKPLTEVSEK